MSQREDRPLKLADQIRMMGRQSEAGRRKELLERLRPKMQEAALKGGSAIYVSDLDAFGEGVLRDEGFGVKFEPGDIRDPRERSTWRVWW